MLPGLTIHQKGAYEDSGLWVYQSVVSHWVILIKVSSDNLDTCSCTHIKGHVWKLLSLQAGKEVVDRLCAEIRQKTQ